MYLSSLELGRRERQPGHGPKRLRLTDRNSWATGQSWRRQRPGWTETLHLCCESKLILKYCISQSTKYWLWGQTATVHKHLIGTCNSLRRDNFFFRVIHFSLLRCYYYEGGEHTLCICVAHLTPMLFAIKGQLQLVILDLRSSCMSSRTNMFNFSVWRIL